MSNFNRIKLFASIFILLASVLTSLSILDKNFLPNFIKNFLVLEQKKDNIITSEENLSPEKVSAGQTLTTTVSAWNVTANLSHKTHPYPMFAYNGALYAHTGNPTNSVTRNVYMGRPDANGNITSWSVAWNDHGGIHGYTALNVDGIPFHFRNGHIAKYKFKPDGTVDGDVELLEDDMDESFGGRKWVWDSAVYVPFANAKYVFHLGGFSMPPDYKYIGDIYRSSVPLGSTFTNTGKKHPDIGSGSGKGAFYLPTPDSTFGYIYTRGNRKSTLFRAKVDSSGNLSDWDNLGTLPTGNDNYKGDTFVLGKTLYMVLGSKVVATDLDPVSGNVIGWSDDPPDLPERQVEETWGGSHLEGATAAVIGNYIYLASSNKVYYARISGGGSPPPDTTGTPTPTTQGSVTPGTSISPTITPTSTIIFTPTKSPIPTRTPTATSTPSPTKTPTSTPTETPTKTPTFTQTPTMTATLTPTPPSVAMCDKSCGVCGWRDTQGICHTDGALPASSTTTTTTPSLTGGAGNVAVNTRCCYSTCIGSVCKQVSGYGSDNCTLGLTCTYGKLAQNTTPQAYTPPVQTTSGPVVSPGITVIYVTATPISLREGQNGGQTSGLLASPLPDRSQATGAFTSVTPTPPVSGNTGWMIVILVPATILMLGLIF